MFLVGCRAFEAEPENVYEWEAPNVWFDWECDGSTLVIVDASPGTDASKVEDACPIRAVDAGAAE